MINKSLPQLCVMLPVCPILVFQLNWRHLGTLGTFDGTSVKWVWSGAVWRVDLRSYKDKSAVCTPGSRIRERNGVECLHGSGEGRVSVSSVSIRVE